VHPEDGLARLEAILEARERLRDVLDVQIVAFPQRGVLASRGTRELLDAAARAGADAIGGLDPAGVDADVEGQLGVVFDIAERHECRVDIHLHDPGTLGTFQLRRIAAHTRERFLQGRVTVSHAYALGMVDPAELAVTAAALADGGVSILTNGPGSDAMPPVLALRAAGVRVFAGSDNIRDAWWPYGTGDMLERAYMIGYRQALYTDAELAVAFDLATHAAAAALGIEDYGLAAGARANLVAVRAGSVAEAVAAPPPGRLVIHAGQIVGSEPGTMPEWPRTP
jgi:cytosine/creatinine deaminase